MDDFFIVHITGLLSFMKFKSEQNPNFNVNM